MATNTNNGSGGRKNHLSPSSSLDGISPCPETYYYTPGWGQRADDEWNSVPLPILFGVFLGVILLLRFFCTRAVRTDMEEQDGRGEDYGASEAAAGWVGRTPSSTVAGAALEMAPPLVCTYRKAEGLGEMDSCGVCLAELVDGEGLRVLPACMHYFHASCIGEWLRAHNTCPLCRAPFVAPGGAT